jgi:hypothetical protein
MHGAEAFERRMLSVDSEIARSFGIPSAIVSIEPYDEKLAFALLVDGS